MDMCFKDMSDGDLPLFCKLQIDLDIRSRINDRSDTGLVIANQVREFGDAFRWYGLRISDKVFVPQLYCSLRASQRTAGVPGTEKQTVVRPSV